MRNSPSSLGKAAIALTARAEPLAAELPGGLAPVFIFPALGCDTALLTRLLDYHPQIHAPGGSLVPEVATREEARAFVESLAEQAISDATMSLRRGRQSTLNAFCMTLAPESDRTLRALLDSFPSAQAICPIRDGRDAVIEDRLAMLCEGELEGLSAGARAHAAAAAAGHLPKGRSDDARGTPVRLFCAESLRMHINRWIESLRTPMRVRELVHDRARFIRQEEFRSETIRTHAATCRWLGVAGDSSHVHSAIEASRTQLAAAAKSGAWRTLLSEADKAMFKRMAGELLIELGYAADTRW